MSNDEVKKILSMSPKKQEEWLKKQEWFDEETIFDDGELFGFIFGNFDEQLEYELDNININEDSLTYSLVLAGHISKKRYKEIIKGEKHTEEEISYLKEFIKNEALDDDRPYTIMKKEIKLNENKLLLFITSQGNPLLGYSKEFEGFFKDDEDAMKFFSKYKDVEFC